MSCFLHTVPKVRRDTVERWLLKWPESLCCWSVVIWKNQVWVQVKGTVLRNVWPFFCLKVSTWAIYEQVKGTVLRNVWPFLLKSFDLGPIWTGKNVFANFFVFARIFAKSVCPHSQRLRQYGVSVVNKIWYFQKLGVRVVVDYADTVSALLLTMLTLCPCRMSA